MIIEPEKVGKKTVYTAYCPTLEVSDYGDTIEEVLESIKDGIALAIECLREENKEVSGDNIGEQLITNIKVPLSPL